MGNQKGKKRALWYHQRCLTLGNRKQLPPVGAIRTMGRGWLGSLKCSSLGSVELVPVLPRCYWYLRKTVSELGLRTLRRRHLAKCLISVKETMRLIWGLCVYMCDRILWNQLPLPGWTLTGVTLSETRSKQEGIRLFFLQSCIVFLEPLIVSV